MLGTPNVSIPQTGGELVKLLHECIDNLVTSENCDRSPHREIQTIIRHWALGETASSGLSPIARTALENIFRIRRIEIINALVKQKLLSEGHIFVESHDWKVKYIMGSSKIANTKDSRAQIDLNCVKLNDESEVSRKLISFECDQKKLDMLISEVRGMKATLDKSQAAV